MSFIYFGIGSASAPLFVGYMPSHVILFVASLIQVIAYDFSRVFGFRSISVSPFSFVSIILGCILEV